MSHWTSRSSITLCKINRDKIARRVDREIQPMARGGWSKALIFSEMSPIKVWMEASKELRSEVQIWRRWFHQGRLVHRAKVIITKLKKLVKLVNLSMALVKAKVYKEFKQILKNLEFSNSFNSSKNLRLLLLLVMAESVTSLKMLVRSHKRLAMLSLNFHLRPRVESQLTTHTRQTRMPT